MIPIIKIQPVRNFRNWIYQNTKKEMETRDNLRTIAGNTDNTEDWNKFRQQRNNLTECVCRDKKKHFEQLYNKADKTNDTRELYRITREQLGWMTGGPPHH